jgi:uncharacterized protein with FMN-binding domain
MKGRLLALSSAAVLAVYTAGYARTRTAAEMLEAEERRPPMPRPGSVDRAPIPATPHDPTLVPATGVQAPPAAAAPSAAAPATAKDIQPRANAVEARMAQAAAPTLAQGALAPAASGTAALASAASVAVTPPALASESGSAPAALAAPAPAAVAPVAAVALAPSETPQMPAAPLGPKWKDGRYTGWGTSRHGDLQASVLIEGGRISTASISQCLTRYPCDWISKLPPQVIQRQSAEVDYVSGATESATAFYYAVLQALSKAAGSQ